MASIPLDFPFPARAAVRRFLAAFGCAAALAAAAPAEAALPVVAGPGDVMRALPPHLARQIAPDRNIAAASPPWSRRLARLAGTLRALDRGDPGGDPSSDVAAALRRLGRERPAALAAAMRDVLRDARDFEWLRFSRAPSGALVGASFLGPDGSRVVVINRGTRALRVRLGSWVRSHARFEVFAPGPGSKAAPHAIFGRVGPGGLVLPPRSVAIAG